MPELVPSSPRKRVALAAGPILFLVVVALPEPQAMVDAARAVGSWDRAPLVALGMLVWMLTWWVTECLPLGLAALAIPLVFGVAGILPWRTLLTSFTDPIIWIFMAGFVLAASFRKWGLDRRISILLASAYRGDDPRVATFFVACLPVFFLTLTGSITASTTVVFPFLVAYLAMLGVRPGSRYSEGSMLALAQAATAGAMLLLISTAPNLVAKGTVRAFSGYDLTFFDWFIVGTPHAFVGLLVSWVVTFAVLRPEMKEVRIDRGRLGRLRRELGRLSRGEGIVLAILLLAVGLWVFPSAFRLVAEANPALVGASDQVAAAMPEAMPAVLVVLLAGLVPVHRGEPVLRWKEIVDAVDWNVVFLFGGGIGLGLGLEASGFARWLGGECCTLLGQGAGTWSVFAVSALLGFVLSYAASNTAAALVACPIAGTIALGAGVSPVGPILGAGLAASISSALPSTTPPMAIVYSSGYVKIWNMFRVGLVSDVIRLAFLIAVGPFLVDTLL